MGAAAAIAAGVVVVARQADQTRTSTTAEAPGGDTTVVPPDAGSAGPPMVLLPGWSTVRYQEIDASGSSETQAIAEDTTGRGRTISVQVVTRPLGLSLEGPTELDVNGAVAHLRFDDIGNPTLVWKQGNAFVGAYGTRVTADEVVELARGLEFESTGRIVGCTSIPEGMTFALTAHGVGGRYRLDVVVGNYTFEFDGEPFASREEFVAIAGSLAFPDHAAWDASLAGADKSTVDATSDAPPNATAEATPAAK